MQWFEAFGCRAGLGSAAFYGAGAPESAASDQAMALLLLKGSLDPSGQALGTWQESTSPCQGWSGVTCNSDGRVTRLCAPPRSAGIRGKGSALDQTKSCKNACAWGLKLAGHCTSGFARHEQAVWSGHEWACVGRRVLGPTIHTWATHSCKLSGSCM